MMGLTPEQRHTRVQKQIEIANRRKLVAVNLLAGATYADIAGALNVSKATVSDDVKAILTEWRANYADTADRYLNLQYRRLDMLLNAVWDLALKGNHSAIDRVLAIMDRQNALMGFDKRPVQNNTTVVPIQIVEVQRHPYPALVEG